MIAVDTNMLVAFHRTEYSTHDRAVAVLTGLAEGTEPWGMPWPCVHEFLAIVTHPRIFKIPSGMSAAVAVIEALMESPVARLLGEGPEYWTGLRALLKQGRITGPKVHDARIAALCLDHRVKLLWTADRDFSRFPGLRCVNPLVG